MVGKEDTLMRTVVLVVFAASILAGCAGLGGLGGTHGTSGRLAGTWERTDLEVPQYRHIKILSGNHFIWVSHDPATGAVASMAGGTYQFDGRVYTERLEFASENLPAELIGEDQFFTAKLDGTLWRHEGTLSNGYQVREVWTRIE
jgi:hypothetical protein